MTRRFLRKRIQGWRSGSSGKAPNNCEDLSSSPSPVLLKEGEEEEEIINPAIKIYWNGNR
jgi:hypothetical protein